MEIKIVSSVFIKEYFQTIIDIYRGGGINGDSDLSLQMTLANMELHTLSPKRKTGEFIQPEFKLENNYDPETSNVCSYLERLFSLQKLCEAKGGYTLEATLKSPEDIEKALVQYEL